MAITRKTTTTSKRRPQGPFRLSHPMTPIIRSTLTLIMRKPSRFLDDLGPRLSPDGPRLTQDGPKDDNDDDDDDDNDDDDDDNENAISY